jgi:hypothetical protein
VSIVASVKQGDEVARFSEEQLACDRAMACSGIPQPTFTALRKHMLKHGPDGILESAVHLESSQYDRLVAQVKKMRYNKQARKWHTV